MSKKLSQHPPQSITFSTKTSNTDVNVQLQTLLDRIEIMEVEIQSLHATNTEQQQCIHQLNKSQRQMIHDLMSDMISQTLEQRVVDAVREEVSEQTLVFSSSSKPAPSTKDSDSQTLPPTPNDRTDTLTKEDAKSSSTSNQTKLSQDSYSLMILSKPLKSQNWWYGLSVFTFQAILFLMIIHGLIIQPSTDTDAILKVPINISSTVRLAQFIAFFVSVIMTKDLTESVKCLTLLLATNTKKNHDLILSYANSSSTSIHRSSTDEGTNDSSNSNKDRKSQDKLYHRMCLWPNVLKFLQGCLALFTSFVVIVQSSNVIDLFKDFLALQVVSSLDNYCFWLCTQGFFGKYLQERTNQLKNLTLTDSTSPTSSSSVLPSLPLQTVVMVGMLLCMNFGWMYIIWGQTTGLFYNQKYPQCQVKLQGFDFRKIGDGICDGGLYNRYECDFDGGDCVNFQLAYPLCSANEPFKLGNGKCDKEYATETCGWDGGDCSCDYPEELGNGRCNAMLPYNSEFCKYDGGDCSEHNKLYPGCFVADSSLIGDGNCDGGLYFSEACHHDGGDCNGCLVDDPSKIGDGSCDPEYDTEACSRDGGDCDSVPVEEGMSMCYNFTPDVLLVNESPGPQEPYPPQLH